MLEESVRIRTLDGQYRLIGGDFQSMLAVVRSIPGRRYQPAEKIWEIPCKVEVVQKAAEAAGFHVTADTVMGEPLRMSIAPRRKRGGADRVLIRVGDEERAVVGGAFADMLEVVKGIEGRRWQPQEGAWRLPGPLAEIEKVIAAHGFRLVTPAEAESLPASASEEAPAAQMSLRKRDRVHIRALDGEAWVVGGGFNAMLQAVKGIEGRRFSSEDKVWELPCALAEVRAALQAQGYQLEIAEETEGSAQNEIPFTDLPSDGLEEGQTI